MEDPEPPPDPLSPPLVPSAESPKSSRSAPSPAPLTIPTPDPSPPAPDLPIDGSIGGSQPSLAINTMAQSPAGAALWSPAGVNASGEHQACSIPSEQHIQGVQRHSSFTSIDAVWASEAQKHSLLTEQLKPSTQPANGAQQHSSPPGFNVATTNQPAQVPPDQHASQGSQWSPTGIIDQEFQAQAWAILPELAKDLNKFKTLKQQQGSTSRGENTVINHRRNGYCKHLEDRTKNPHEDSEFHGALLQSRIPACKKGKATLLEEGIQG